MNMFNTCCPPLSITPLLIISTRRTIKCSRTYFGRELDWEKEKENNLDKTAFLRDPVFSERHTMCVVCTVSLNEVTSINLATFFITVF